MNCFSEVIETCTQVLQSLLSPVLHCTPIVHRHANCAALHCCSSVVVLNCCAFVGEPPSSFPEQRLKIDFSKVEMSHRLRNLLEGLLGPAWEDRLTATQAQALLAGQQQRRHQDTRGWNSSSQESWEDMQSRSSASGRQVLPL